MHNFLKFSFLCLILIQCSFSQNIHYTKRQRNDVRSGPGSYYDLLVSIPKGVAVDIVQYEQNWIRIRTPDKTKGWISKNCLSEKLPEAQTLKELSKEWSSPNATKAGVAAAVRGFAEKFGNANEGDLSFLSHLDKHIFSPEEYQSFLEETLKELSPDTNQHTEHFVSEAMEHTFADEGIGAGVASRIATKGLVNNPKLHAYINLIGTYLVESTPSYDIRFHFFILNDEKLTAYSVPGGFIFISTGMLHACSNEAELAGVLAHEVAHILLQHGIKELHSRTMMINLQQRLRDVQKLISEELKETQHALELYSSDIWELVHRPRSITMEEEADNVAASLLLRCGYDANALAEMIQKIERDAKRALTKQYDQQQVFSFVDFKQRKAHLQQVLENAISVVHGKLNIERFHQHIK
jgi:hypothetical protein